MKKKVKKQTKKSSKVKKKKVKKKQRKRKKIGMEDIYKKINRVQLKKKKVEFAVELNQLDTVENILKDIDVKYKIIERKTMAIFTLIPDDKEDLFDFDDLDMEYLIDLEYMDDEIPEEGQIF